MAKAIFSRLSVLNGIVIRSTVNSGIIDTIKLPPLGNRFLTVEARDIKGDNRVKVANDYIPLLSSNQISYKGQPIMALFGFDSESVQLKAQKIEINYRLSETKELQNKTVSYAHEAGDFEGAITNKDVRTLSQSYDYSRLNSSTIFITRITVGMDNGILHVYAPTQWVFHMRDTISDVTLIPKKKIIIHRLPFFATNDEMLLNPSLLASIAALACIKSNYPIEIKDNYPVFRPAVHINRKSYFLSEGKPIAEEVQATVDQGASALFSEEMANQMFAGFYPPCDLKGVRFSIDFTTSEQSPAHFFGELGYCKALSSTEAQYSQVARACNMSPDDWKTQYYSDSHNYSDLVLCEHFSKIKPLVSELSKKSDFQRKYSAYELQKSQKGKFSTFFSYARGIGLSVGPGISGLSWEYKYLPSLNVQIQLNPGDQVKVNCSFYSNGNSAKIWKRIISEELGIKDENISFPADDEEMVDSGPSVLASNSGRMPSQIQKTCLLIKEKRFVAPLPICESVGSFKNSDNKNSMFSSSNWVSAVLELDIDTIVFQPMVRKVWLSVLTGRIFDERAFNEKIRHVVVTTLRESGAVLAEGRDLTIDVTIKSEGDDVSSSVTSAVKATVMASFCSALQQALGTTAITLPITSDMILASMRRLK